MKNNELENELEKISNLGIKLLNSDTLQESIFKWS